MYHRQQAFDAGPYPAKAQRKQKAAASPDMK
jgi:hypothetical protein